MLCSSFELGLDEDRASIYVLELDANGRIVGGEWVGESKQAHPDFLWLPLKASGTTVAGGAIKIADVKALMAASVK